MARHTLVYSAHQLTLEEILNFVEVDWFVRAWKELGLDDEKSLAALQILIMCNPKGAPVIPGTGGVRKLRYSPPDWDVGKRGALRVCYVYFEKYGLVVLLLVYAKGEMDNISQAGKQAMQTAIGRIETSLKKRFGF
jgi:hypothetical protein